MPTKPTIGERRLARIIRDLEAMGLEVGWRSYHGFGSYDPEVMAWIATHPEESAAWAEQHWIAHNDGTEYPVAPWVPVMEKRQRRRMSK